MNATCEEGIVLYNTTDNHINTIYGMEDSLSIPDILESAYGGLDAESQALLDAWTNGSWEILDDPVGIEDTPVVEILDHSGLKVQDVPVEESRNDPGSDIENGPVEEHSVSPSNGAEYTPPILPTHPTTMTNDNSSPGISTQEPITPTQPTGLPITPFVGGGFYPPAMQGYSYIPVFMAYPTQAPFSLAPPPFVHAYMPHASLPMTTSAPAVSRPPSNKRSIEFAQPTTPGDVFVANPNNHGRWKIDSFGNRTYLNAPKAKKQRAG